jgi:hypothetical protein
VRLDFSLGQARVHHRRLNRARGEEDFLSDGRGIGFTLATLAALCLLSLTAFPAAGHADTTPTCFGRPATIVGTPGNDQLAGTASPDVIVALGGDDKIGGAGGDDLICAGPGADLVSAEGGSDRVSGGPGDDQLLGGNGRDRLDGGTGTDGCTGGAGRNMLRRCEGRARKSTLTDLRQDLPPMAMPDAASTREDTAVAVAVLTNDTDLDGGPKLVESVSVPAHGSAALTAGGSAVIYVPAPNYCGPDSFGYALNGGSTASVTVEVACVDDPPVATPDSFELSENDDRAVLPVLENDADVDGPPPAIGQVGQPGHGSVSIVADGTALEYVPEAGYCNESGPLEEFSYTLKGGPAATVRLSVACLAAAPDAIDVTTSSPELFPSFDRSVDDYVVRCDGSPLGVSATMAAGYSVSIDGQAQATGSADAQVALQAGQEFTFTVFHGRGRHSYFVRCLPEDFPAFSVATDGPREAQWYVVTPTLFASPAGVSTRYVAFFDNDGVPVWWYRTEGPNLPLDAKLLPDGNVAWLYYTGGGAEERSLDGSLVRKLDTVGSTADHHVILLLPNGDYLMERYVQRSGVDLTECGGPASGTLLDPEIQELTPGGDLVWSWTTSDHIPLSEVGAGWRPQCTSTGDAYHLNSIEPDGDGYVLSFRHLDAVYRIDRSSGNIDWKLGGVHRPESLTVIGDPLSPVSTFGGQHDARVLPDGTVTVFDDGSLQSRAPRSLRFSIDESAGTATVLEDVEDAATAASSCCGSTRRLSGGHWVTSWGSNDYVTEQAASGARVFTLTFPQHLASYRASPLLPGIVSPAELRAGMDSQFPR